MLIGLTGGIGSGKSTVSALLRARGVPVIDADEIGRAALTAGSPLLPEVVAAFGSHILDDQGRLDRRKLRAEIFSSPTRREQLNRLVHPYIARQRDLEIDRLRANHSVLFYDAALLLESEARTLMDAIVVVACEPEVQIRRVMERDGISRQQAVDAINAQMSLEGRLACADYVIDNNRDDMAHLEKQVDELLALLTQQAGRHTPQEK